MEMNNSPNSRFEQAEECSNLEGRTLEIIESEERKDKRLMKSEQNPRDQWDTIKQINVHIVRLPDKRERKGQREYLKK